MWFSSVPAFRSSGARRTRSLRRPSHDRRRAAQRRLTLELLEDRCLLSFSLGALVPVAPVDPFVGCTFAGHYLPDNQAEPRVAVDPTNSKHIVGVWMQDFGQGEVAGVSFDAGQTWTQVVIPGVSTCSGGGSGEKTGDPWVSFGPTGSVYISELITSFDPNGVLATSGVAVNTSPDGGLTWSQPTVLIQNTLTSGQLNDKDSITADPYHPNLVYTVWDGVGGGLPGRAFFDRSTDGGRTWLAPQVIFQSPSNAPNIGHQIVVLPNGTLVDAFTGSSLDIIASSD
jgi:hypothetical protein